MPTIIPEPGEGWDGTEFAVDPAGLQGVAGEVGRVYDDINDAVADWNNVALSSAEPATPDVASAHQKFMQTYSIRTSAEGSTLGDIVKTLSTAKQLYEETEHSSAVQLRWLQP